MREPARVLEGASKSRKKPLVFISHDTRESDLARAFETLLTATSGGTLESFRSESIPYGENWYSSLMKKLRDSTHVVALFTRNSVERPWIFYEAGAAKGAFNRKVIGLTLGIELDSVKGPFTQFQNCRCEEEDIIRLLQQLIPSARKTNIRDQVKNFLNVVDRIIPLGIFGKIGEEEFLKYLFNTRPLRQEEATVDRFRKSEDSVLARFFLDYHWEHYTKAIEQAASISQALPLPSELRMKVAKEAIMRSKGVRAISVFDSDQWIKAGRSTYLKANREAVKRGCRIQRVMIFNTKKELNAPSALRSIKDQERAGVDLRLGIYREIKKHFEKLHGDRESVSPVTNILISDIGIITRSASNDPSHGGEITLNPTIFKTEKDRFDEIWHFLHKR